MARDHLPGLTAGQDPPTAVWFSVCNRPARAGPEPAAARHGLLSSHVVMSALGHRHGSVRRTGELSPEPRGAPGMTCCPRCSRIELVDVMVRARAVLTGSSVPGSTAARPGPPGRAGCKRRELRGGEVSRHDCARSGPLRIAASLPRGRSAPPGECHRPGTRNRRNAGLRAVPEATWNVPHACARTGAALSTLRAAAKPRHPWRDGSEKIPACVVTFPASPALRRGCLSLPGARCCQPQTGQIGTFFFPRILAERSKISITR